MARKTQYTTYDDDFKSTAVALSNVPDVKIKDVADALVIHPVMLYRWRLEMRRGELMPQKEKITIDPKMAAELKRLHQLEKEHKQLLMEHDLLKKASCIVHN